MKTEEAIIGYTGFVGSNLQKQYQYKGLYNSKNISSIRDTHFNRIICAGVSAVKWLANQNPQKDKDQIDILINSLKDVTCEHFTLISTIDIYDTLGQNDESIIPDERKQDTYGKNRYYLEQWVKEHFKNHLIVRLPALFGEGLKKNFIYDLINPLPAMITQNKMSELRTLLSSAEYEKIEVSYEVDELLNFLLKKDLTQAMKDSLLPIFKKLNFTSLNFTDTRSSFPFYYLNNLKKDIELAKDNNLQVINFSVEPISCEEIATKMFNIEVKNEIIGKEPVFYDMISCHANYWGKNKYLYSKQETLVFLKEYLIAQGFTL